ncbi:MAG TPA: excalibur calcium-binding domain-containing protein, partial [Acidimicrobiales bacterium]|nr:excalibur calcium-binding domain-containing protein [Acidimicrobiales bacterium]
MRALRFVLGLTLVVGLAGCNKSDATVMPDVKGRRLDVALSDIKRAGFKHKVEVVGGGTFGVVVKSHWMVCEQLPAAGQALKEAPRVTVSRSCDSGTKRARGTAVKVSTTTTSTTTAPPPTTAPPTTTPPPLSDATYDAVPTTDSNSPPPPSDVYYANCDAARAAGAAPLSRGEPGYRSGLDRDGDGVACET